MACNDFTDKKNKKRYNHINKAKKSRRIKQYIMGTIFLILLTFGWFYSLIGYFIPLCMIAGIGIASRKGRKWCNWMCPRGSFSDSYMKVISPERKIPYIFRSSPLRIGVIIFLISMLTYQTGRLWPDLYAIGKLFMILLTVTTVIGIILAIIIHQRTWCYICPIGTVSSWVGKNRQPLSVKGDLCTDCKLCKKLCPMGLTPDELKEKGQMSFGEDCLKCGLCMGVCPSDALSFSK